MRASPLALTVLFMLLGGPLHPYEMQRRMKLWGKDQVVNLAQRASLYKTIERLRDAGLIAVLHTERDQRFPERTVYQLTDDGLHTGRQWLVEMLGVPHNEYPRFPAALSFVFALAPDEAAGVLEHRAFLLRAQLDRLDAELRDDARPRPPRVTLLETEYVRTLTAAELGWLDAVVLDLRSGALQWSGEELRALSETFLG